MTIFRLRATLTDWGYQRSQWLDPSPLPTPPTADYTARTWRQWPGYLRWELQGAGGVPTVSIIVAHQPRSNVGEVPLTQLRLGGATTTFDGYAEDVEVEAWGAGELRLRLDGVEVWRGPAPGVPAWVDRDWWVLGEGNSGLSIHQLTAIDGGTGYGQLVGHEVTYHAADLRVWTPAGEQPVLPADADRTHVWAGGAMSGAPPAAIKRQPLLVRTRAGGRAGWAAVARPGGLEAVVAEEVSVEPGPALVAAPGDSVPVAGWLAGLRHTGTYTLGTTWAEPRPLGLGSGVGRSAKRGAAVFQRRGPDDWRAWPPVDGAPPALVLTANETVLLPGSPPTWRTPWADGWRTGGLLPDGRLSQPWAWAPAGAWVAAADWGHEDHPLMIACQPTADGLRLVCRGWAPAVTVGEVDGAELGEGVPWPWLLSGPGGRREVGLLAGGRYREWHAPPDGRHWALVRNEPVAGPTRLLAASATRGPGETLAAVAYDPVSAALWVWWRPAPASGWLAPVLLTHVSQPVAAHLAVTSAGGWRAGWRTAGGAWAAAEAPVPTGPWSVA